MALVQSHHLYPRTTTLVDSVNKFNVTATLHLFRYSSSVSFKNQYSYERFDNLCKKSRNPTKRFNFFMKDRCKSLSVVNCDVFCVSFCSVSCSSGNGSGSSWLGKWSEFNRGVKVKKPQVVLNYRNNGYVSNSDGEDNNGSRSDTTGSTMERIVEKLKKFGYMDDVVERKEEERRVIEKGSIEDIFYVEEGMLPNSRGGFSEKSPLGDETVFGRDGDIGFPWENKEVGESYSVRQKSRTSFAQMTLPQSELQRLKNVALRIKNKTRITGAGVTKEIVDKIHEKWKSSEVARVKVEGPPALNMKRMHEILERKTGGLVIWRSGTSVSLYRGINYEASIEKSHRRSFQKDVTSCKVPRINDGTSELAVRYNQHDDSSSSQAGSPYTGELAYNPHDYSSASPASSPCTVEEDKGITKQSEINYEDEIDHLLAGLGPRYTDWPGGDPLPVDADLLPGVVPGYQPPFRLLPYGVRSTLGGKEATDLRRLARVLPPHFAVGRSRQHQGLAAAMVKLWERSSVAKIALKRGVQLTTSERMAEDIKRLTGAILLSRNKDFLVFYRGKDFLRPDVAEALLEKEKLAKTLQEEEEQARLRASSTVTANIRIADEVRISAGTLGETLDADARWGKKLDDRDKGNIMREAALLTHANLVRKLDEKLALAERKIMKAERALAKVEESLNPADQSADSQSISDEERFMFRKLGLRMKAFLLLGRRGVFDGTVENMHLHWKYRELIKIIVKAKNFEEVKNIAISLEAESGGVLVSVDKVSKGYAIIVFRGKDYHRPSTLRPRNLLTKRKALARSIELQRREALLNHISTLQSRVNQLRVELEQMAAVKDHGDEELYKKLDSYLSEDEESEEEGDEGTYDSDTNFIDEIVTVDDEVETNFPYVLHDESEAEVECL
ncbi:hypothetical protein Leryth_017181 [Lithospermum erythrorhizon]|nr:hypothetical protein Leryth_017181 [Lithospermum erythrorhizon]